MATTWWYDFANSRQLCSKKGQIWQKYSPSPSTRTEECPGPKEFACATVERVCHKIKKIESTNNVVMDKRAVLPVP